MNNFDVAKWNKQRYLAEANLLESKAQEAATAIDKILDEIDPSGILPEDLGEAIAIIVKKGYQAELQEKFMDALQAKLGMKSLNEAEESEIESLDLWYTERAGLFNRARAAYKDGSTKDFFGAKFDDLLKDLGINKIFAEDDDIDREIIKSLKDKNIKITFSEKDVS
jgi:hypothetical protein